tara:strand:+ start:276 stop:542 length:267 start_codon:yes stop_codon:yes gene_type:complete
MNFLEENFEFLSFLEDENYKTLEVFKSIDALAKELYENEKIISDDIVFEHINFIGDYKGAGVIKHTIRDDVLGKYRILKSGQVELLWK